MLRVFGGLPEFERELIRARTGKGRKRASADVDSILSSDALALSLDGVAAWRVVIQGGSPAARARRRVTE